MRGFNWIDDSEAIVKRPRREKVETIAKVFLPDGRGWEVRVSYSKGAGNCWIPSVWVRCAKRIK
jgi:hypothetical protein